jgi:hypothetical protein
MRRVVDTNVAVIANNRPVLDKKGRNKSATAECRLAAQRFLKRLIKNGRIVLDDLGHIQAEYRSHLNPSGQPGVGDQFYQLVLQSHPRRVLRVDIGCIGEDEYEAFPRHDNLVKFDRSDRKFAAAGLVAECPVTNAVDSDWVEHSEALLACNVQVEMLCGCNEKAWFD